MANGINTRRPKLRFLSFYKKTKKNRTWKLETMLSSSCSIPRNTPFSLHKQPSCKNEFSHELHVSSSPIFFPHTQNTYNNPFPLNQSTLLKHLQHTSILSHLKTHLHTSIISFPSSAHIKPHFNKEPTSLLAQKQHSTITLYHTTLTSYHY